MPGPIQYPLINGARYGWSSVEVKLAGFSYYGIKSLNYKHSLEPGELRGTRSQLIGRTRGKYSADGSIEFYRLEYDDFIARLSVLGQPFSQGYLEVAFDIVASYREDSALVQSSDLLRGCRLKSADRSYSEGADDALTVKCDLHYMGLFENGRSPVGPLPMLR